jgi:23S rRNA (adenine2503-C2)-methyltransferase
MEYKFPVTLSISLHAPNDEIRSSIMRVNNKWNVETLIKACKDYIKTTGRRISFEYAVISGVNDSDSCAKELAKLLKGMLCHVNLIPANPVKENSFSKPDRAKILHFCELLNSLGINTTIRRTLGADIDASCGQLRGKHLEEN